MNDYAAAVHPPVFTVMGKRLEPFSIGHGRWLQRLGCDPVDSYENLITAVLICSRPVTDIRATLNDHLLRLKIWLWGRRLGNFDVPAAIMLFHEYITAHSQSPSVFSHPGGELPGAPWLQHLRVSLISHGWPPQEVESMTYAQALWDYYTYWENEGQAEIVEDRFDHEVQAWGNTHHAEILRQANEMLRAEKN